MSVSVIIGGARTPMGRLLGSLKDHSAVDLGAHAISHALARSHVSPELVQHVIMGNVIQAGNGQNPARQAAVAAGIGMQVPALTVNKVCLSSLEAIAYADFMIRAGEADVFVAGGMESMTRAPHLLPGGREGVKYGSWELQDSIAEDALTDSFERVSMGTSSDRYNQQHVHLTREEQDAVALRSHQRAQAASSHGLFAHEIAPISIPQRKGPDLVLGHDEGVRADVTMESLARLKPAFVESGTITAGNASQLSDGAAAVVVMSRARAESLGLQWIAEIVTTASVAGPDPSLAFQPANATLAALAKAGLTVGDLSLVEFNEAFAAVAISSQRKLGIPDDILNVNGGAIAMGHPVGMSGARLTLHLALELGRRGGGYGAAALCGGGGQGNAIIIKV
ncbi:MAG: acetyl-CoA C-acetyltransferase [Candidatus Nanopelagicales bacterium]